MTGPQSDEFVVDTAGIRGPAQSKVVRVADEGVFLRAGRDWMRVTDLRIWLLAQIHETEMPAGHADELREMVARHSMGTVFTPDSFDGQRVESPDFYCEACVYRPGVSTGFAIESNGVDHEEDPCQVLRRLALPYSDRPGYQEGWRPA